MIRSLTIFFFLGLVSSSFAEDSNEIDSSEFGGPPGSKGTTCDCGWTNKKLNERIIGGVETKPNEYPFIVRILMNGSLCGGSIITPRHILTAGHCTAKKQASNIVVTVAEHDVLDEVGSPNRKQYKVERIINHPKFRHYLGKYDISILLLKKEIEFHKDVGRICLPNGPIEIENKFVKVMGWGRYSNDNDYIINALNVVTLKVLTYKECSEAWNGTVSVENPNQLCTFAEGKSACSGDSGGPIVWLDPETNRYTIVSLNSKGKTDASGPCGNSIPRIGTRISSYLDWIKQTVDETAPAQLCTKQN